MNPIKKEIEDLERFEEIVGILSRQGFGFFLGKLGITRKHRKKKPSPERLRETIEELGPTFVKFGQIMGERPDIVPEKYIEELQKLQDDAPRFDSGTAMEIVEEEIGTEEFERIEDEPIAAASLAQVHRARLDSGEDVIIKIRRPGIKDQIEKDLEILRYLSNQAEKHFESMHDIRIGKLVQEFSTWTRNELDFEREASNAQIFKNNLRDEEKLEVPEVYPDLTTEKVLVMEYVDGIKCTETEKMKELDIDTEELAETTIRAGFRQVVMDGFFHADPHPSNFLLKGDGTIVYLDFGMMGQISKKYRDKIDLFFIYALNEDSEKVLDILTDIGWTEDDADLEIIEEKIDEKVLRIKNSKIKQASISQEFLDLFFYAGRHGLHLPLSFTLMGKNLLTLEGIGLTLCPDFRPTEEYQEVGEELLREKNSPEKLADEAFLDMMANKDLIARPASSFRELVSREQKEDGSATETTIEIKLLPAALILSSALLFMASYFRTELLYIGLFELILGLYFHQR